MIGNWEAIHGSGVVAGSFGHVTWLSFLPAFHRTVGERFIGLWWRRHFGVLDRSCLILQQTMSVIGRCHKQELQPERATSHVMPRYGGGCVGRFFVTTRRNSVLCNIFFRQYNASLYASSYAGNAQLCSKKPSLPPVQIA